MCFIHYKGVSIVISMTAFAACIVAFIFSSAFLCTTFFTVIVPSFLILFLIFFTCKCSVEGASREVDKAKASCSCHNCGFAQQLCRACLDAVLNMVLMLQPVSMFLQLQGLFASCAAKLNIIQGAESCRGQRSGAGCVISNTNTLNIRVS